MIRPNAGTLAPAPPRLSSSDGSEGQVDKKSGWPKKRNELRVYREQIAEAALALDSVLGGQPNYALSLLRDAARAEEAAEEASKAQISRLHLASDFIKAAPAGVNPFLASVVLNALMRARQNDAKNWDGWKGKLRHALSEWVPAQPARTPSSFSAVVALGLEYGAYTVEQIAKTRGVNPQTIRTAASEGRRRLGLPRLRLRKRRLT